MRFVDRLSGESSARPPERTHFGRWLVADDDRPGHVNGLPASDGDVLSPGATGDWALVRPRDTVPIRVRFFPHSLPPEQDAEALLQLGNVLRGQADASGRWLDWIAISPLAPGLDDAVNAHPLEERIDTEMKHMAAVCGNPRTHIRRETERVLAPRARRIARDAPAQLASHTEDWEHRTVTGIRPRRILADVREERWDLYENRVTVRLVDDLVAWLTGRISEVRRIHNDIYARMEEIRGSASGTRHRAHRIYTLWGKAWDDSLGAVAESTLKRLEDLRYKVLGLMDSRLYRRIPRRIGAADEMRTTNLFANDDHYRGVARLWHEWWGLAVPRSRSTSELLARYQSLHRSFDYWCMLVVVHACSQLRLDPAAEDARNRDLRPGSAIQLDQGVQISWQRDGTITIGADGGTRVRFVPLIQGLEGERSRSRTEERIEPVVEAVGGMSCWTVVLHPAMPGQPPHSVLAGIGNPPLPGTRGAIDFIRVSPFALDSVERVSRAIRWATLAPRMFAYPPEVRPVPASASETLPDLQAAFDAVTNDGPWRIECRNGDAWAIVRRPPETTMRIVSDCTERARTSRRRTAEELREVQGELSRRRGDRRLGELNRRKRRLLEKQREAEDHVTWLESFEAEMQAAIAASNALATCPACGRTDAAFETRDQRCFAAQCRSCAARWELRYDANPDEVGRGHYAGEGRIPIFERHDDTRAELPEAAVAAEVDDVLGCDVLALPMGRDKFHRPRSTVRCHDHDRDVSG